MNCPNCKNHLDSNSYIRDFYYKCNNCKRTYAIYEVGEIH